MGSNDVKKAKDCGQARNFPFYHNRHVKIGNWAEDMLSEEVNQRRMWFNLLRGDTMTQKVNDVNRDFFRAVELPSDSRNVMFGQLIQLRNPCLRAYDGQQGLTLAITLSEDDIDIGPSISPGTRLSATTLKSPCVRNTFQIIPVEPVSSGETVKCKDIFMLKSAARPGLVVEADPPKFGAPQHPYNKAVVRLTDRPSKNCWYDDVFRKFWWVAEYKRLRGETPKERQPIRVQEEMVIRKATNGEALAIESNLIYSTFFGKEYSVTASNPSGRVDLMTPEILWEFVSGIV